jgi:hypothetical protein
MVAAAIKVTMTTGFVSTENPPRRAIGSRLHSFALGSSELGFILSPLVQASQAALCKATAETAESVAKDVD